MHASVIVLLALAAVASAQFNKEPVPILNYQHNRDINGQQYSLAYSTGDGAAHSDRLTLKAGPEGHFPVKEGEYRYTAPNGEQVSLQYRADENGYRATGSHIPKEPTAQ